MTTYSTVAGRPRRRASSKLGERSQAAAARYAVENHRRPTLRPTMAAVNSAADARHTHGSQTAQAVTTQAISTVNTNLFRRDLRTVPTPNKNTPRIIASAGKLVYPLETGMGIDEPGSREGRWSITDDGWRHTNAPNDGNC